MRRPLPPLRSIALRFALVGGALLVIGGLFATAIVEPLLPVFDRALRASSSDFTVLEVLLDRHSAQPIVVRANLSHVQLVGAGVVYPIGFGGGRSGGYQITLTSGGILQHALFLLIIVLAWPAAWREFALRAAMAVPLAGLLVLQDVVVTVLAELWFPIHDEYAPGEFWPLLSYSRFLMGGGGLALAMALAALVIALAVRLERRFLQPATRSLLPVQKVGEA